MKRIIVAVFVLVLSACSYIPPRYSISEDNTMELKKLGADNINVGAFTATAEFDDNCSITAGVVGKPDITGFQGYIKKAFIKELQQAGLFDDKAPKITLTGVVEKLSFSSRRDVYTSSWNITVRLNSSNGKSVRVSVQHDFDAGAGSQADCQIIADNYMPAVQKILGKLISSPEFQSLVTP